MGIVHRLITDEPVNTLDDYLDLGGGAALEAARAVGPEALIAEVEASGLRGRGGAGFPTGRKWRTVRAYDSPSLAASVVVNAAEGEPGTFKDRFLLRRNPFPTLEGALIAALAVGADQVIIGMKREFTAEVARMNGAVEAARAAGWLDGVDLTVFEGPDEYLYGEETALLETIDGRYPFPRIAPPYRRGVREVLETEEDVDANVSLSAHVEMAGPGGTDAPPTLVDNVETLANIPGIIARGADWFRMVGTAESPGTVLVTITGSTRRAAVDEVELGTPLREAIDRIGGGARDGHRIRAVLPGVSGALIPESLLDTPLSYEGMAGIGSGLGSAGFVVLDDDMDLVGVVAGASRFLSIESCGQCTPCKQDGLSLADRLQRLARGEAGVADVDEIHKRVASVADEARCALAGQQQTVVGSLLRLFPGEVEGHLGRGIPPVEPTLIAELVDIEGDVAVWDERHRDKRPDWTYGDPADWSGKSPADRLDDHRMPEVLED